jgi:uncharacterized protein
MERRAYSKLDIKSIDDEKWIISGIASTPEVDRVGDVVESTGAKFDLPLPLLWQHDADKPIGEVTAAKASKDGITFTARIEKASSFTSVALKERALEAWESIRHGLTRGVSIGFSALDYSFMDGGGLHFREWLWLELSVVTVPAHQSATITAIKHFDQHAIRGARSLAPLVKHCEHLPRGARSLTSPGASGIRLIRSPNPEGE